MKVYIDGASRGNPGSAGIGVVLCTEEGELLREISEPIGVATNNVAEYHALIRGLEEAQRLGAQEVTVYTDSELLARQMNGEYAVHAVHLLPLYRRATELLRRFKCARVYHVPRAENAQADRLAKQGANHPPTAPSEPSP